MRARIKSFEDMPEKYKCCPKTISRMRPYCGKEVNLNPQAIEEPNYMCPHCGTHYPELIFTFVDEPEYCLQIDMVDIDEGQEVNA